MRQFAGFGSPEETNKRFKFLLKNGQNGLSVAFDMPTLMGYDPNNEISMGEVGHCGVSISNLKDMEVLFEDIDLSKVSVSMTINGPAIILFAFYVFDVLLYNIQVTFFFTITHALLVQRLTARWDCTQSLYIFLFYFVFQKFTNYLISVIIF